MTTPQRRSTVPRLDKVGTQGMAQRPARGLGVVLKALPHGRGESGKAVLKSLTGNTVVAAQRGRSFGPVRQRAFPAGRLAQ